MQNDTGSSQSQLATVRRIASNSPLILASLDYLLAHAQAAAFRLVTRTKGVVKGVEFQLAQVRRNPFAVQVYPGHLNFYLRQPILAEHPALFQAAEARFEKCRPNRRGEYRLHLRSPSDVDLLLDFLRREGAWPSHRHDRRFIAATYEPVTGEHLLRAARRLAEGERDHPFGESTAYDVLFDDKRLPPKAVFGLAASEALGFTVRPENFSAGEGTTCFRVLREHGYPVVRKGTGGPVEADGLADEDRLWSEGDSRLRAHLRRERATGLAAAKRDRFRTEHGRLLCERCDLDPVAAYGAECGEACIEVHHRATALAEMAPGHQTRLEDLMCLCANCHRVTHRELATALNPAR